MVEKRPALKTETAAREVELCQLDLRYEGYRMKNPGLEERLLGSISQRGIEAPLEGVEVEQVSMLLNGFKRYRCARKLQLRLAPYVSLGQDEGSGIVNRLRISNTKALGILEQAACIDELKHTRPLSLADIAEQLARSKSWVSLRVGLSAPMSGTVRAKLFSGALPAYAYLYLLRRFMRLNGVTGEPVDQFVTAVSGKKLSVREIEQLAHGYFRGPASFRQEILKGNWARPLKQIAQGPQSLDGCSEFERVLLHDLELTQRYLQRITGKSHDPRLQSRAFHAQAHLLTAGLLSRVPAFTQNPRQLQDRSGKA